MQMTLRTFIKNYAEIVRQTKIEKSLKLAKGQCANMETYNREIGRIEGLDGSVALMRDMLGQIEAADDDKDLPEMEGDDK